MSESPHDVPKSKLSTIAFGGVWALSVGAISALLLLSVVMILGWLNVETIVENARARGKDPELVLEEEWGNLRIGGSSSSRLNPTSQRLRKSTTYHPNGNIATQSYEQFEAYPMLYFLVLSRWSLSLLVGAAIGYIYAVFMVLYRAHGGDAVTLGSLWRRTLMGALGGVIMLVFAYIGGGVMFDGGMPVRSFAVPILAIYGSHFAPQLPEKIQNVLESRPARKGTRIE